MNKSLISCTKWKKIVVIQTRHLLKLTRILFRILYNGSPIWDKHPILFSCTFIFIAGKQNMLFCQSLFSYVKMAILKVQIMQSNKQNHFSLNQNILNKPYFLCFLVCLDLKNVMFSDFWAIELWDIQCIKGEEKRK